MIPMARKRAPRAPQIKVSSPEHVLPAEREPDSERARARESKDERASHWSRGFARDLLGERAEKHD